jgi:hypothetical protein
VHVPGRHIGSVNDTFDWKFQDQRARANTHEPQERAGHGAASTGYRRHVRFFAVDAGYEIEKQECEELLKMQYKYFSNVLL